MRKNNSQELELLAVPTHYVLSDQIGSEFKWSYEIYRGLSDKYISSVFVTGGADFSSKNLLDLKIFQTKLINLKLINVIRFHIISQAKAILLAYNSEILMHILPFEIGRSINLLFFLPFLKNCKIVGPIQQPLSILDNDLAPSDARANSAIPKVEGGIYNLFSKLNSINIFYKLLRRINLSMLKRCDALIVINHSVMDRLISMGIQKERIHIITPGVNVNRYNSLIQRKLINSDRVELLVVSLLIKRKAIDEILRAFKLSHDENPNLKLTIVGDGPQMDILLKLRHELELEESVTFRGSVPNNQISDIYSSSDIFLNMSKSEGFATISLEALAAGLPIISTKVGGFNEVVAENENGYLIEIGDYQAMAEKIIFLSNNTQLIYEFGQKSKQIAEEKYDWENSIIPQYIQVLEDAKRKIL